MEERAIELFTRFSHINTLYRASDGEYFVELEEAQAYVANLVGGGAYTVITRTTPLPPSPTPLEENVPIWVYVANPAIAGGLRYDGVVSSTNDTVGTLGNVAHTTNNIGAFRVNNFVMATVRSGGNVGMTKYGKIVAIAANVITINWLSFTGTANAQAADWEISLSGAIGIPGPVGPAGLSIKILNSTNGAYTLTADDNGKLLIIDANSNVDSINANGFANGKHCMILSQCGTNVLPAISRQGSSSGQMVQLPFGTFIAINVVNDTMIVTEIVTPTQFNKSTMYFNTAAVNLSTIATTKMPVVELGFAGAKTVNIPFWETGKELRIINVATTGSANINFPSGETTRGNLASCTITAGQQVRLMKGSSGFWYYQIENLN